MELQFTSDPAAFLAAASPWLARDPVLTTVVATVAERSARAGTPGPDGSWYAVAHDRGDVVGVAMRTAPFAPRPVFALPMPDEAARRAARACHDRGEQVTQVNGALPTSLTWLEETARLAGGTVVTGRHTRLFEAREVVDPRPVPGRLRPASTHDLDLVEAWHRAFHRDADEQAGRSPGVVADDRVDRGDLASRVDAGRVWLWEDADGRVVHLTGLNAPAFGAARVGPVYTPPEHRGHGWASAAVATLTRRVLDDGARPCLFTDQANPTSNAIYQALGYRPVVDMVELELIP